MTPFPTRTALAVLLPLAITVGCGGGSGTSIQPSIGAATEQPSNTTGDTDAGTDSTNPENPGAAIAATVSGRVADGYLQGATVCVDINENGACDDDEPSAISGQGGAYDLDIPAGATDKPIIADVPATAIDEDTGQAIGKKLILSTPADRPEFISPITTLVHEELKENPNFTVEEAEGSVKEELGLSGDERAGLFVDYVANQKNGDDAEDYKFLHQTARVIATMMDEIQDQVEQAATDNGLDFTSDDDTRKAMRQLVRKEVRELLTDISIAVADEIQQRESETEDGTQETNSALLVDVDALAERLERKESKLDFVERIDAIREQSEVKTVAVKDLLEQGMYWLEVECHHEEIYESEAFDEEPVDSVKVILDDDGTPSPVNLPSDCYAEYGHVSVTTDTNELVEATYEYDTDSGSWVERIPDDDEETFAFHLVDGQWVAATHDGPSGPVEFLDDGGAVLESGMGKMLVYATSHALDNTRVLHHIYRLGGNDEFSDLIGEDALFPEGSAVHHLGVKRQALTHVLFNWEPHEDDADCAEFNGNCNVVDVMDDAGFAPATSLAAIREQSMYGVTLAGIAHNHYRNRAIDLKLMAFDDAVAADGMPEAGVANWYMAPDQADTHMGPDGNEYNPDGTVYYPDGAEYNPDGSEYKPDIHEFDSILTDCVIDEDFSAQTDDGRPKCSDLALPPLPECPDELVEDIVDIDELLKDSDIVLADTMTVDANQDGVIDDRDFKPLPPVDYCHHDNELMQHPEGESAMQFDNADGTVSTSDSGIDPERHYLGKTEWKLITVDGVTMIQIGMPVRVKHETDAEGFAAFLLIEDSGYVRRGARMSDMDNDDTVMYSEAAFSTLQSVAEDYVSR